MDSNVTISLIELIAMLVGSGVTFFGAGSAIGLLFGLKTLNGVVSQIENSPSWMAIVEKLGDSVPAEYARSIAFGADYVYENADEIAAEVKGLAEFTKEVFDGQPANQ